MNKRKLAIAIRLIPPISLVIAIVLLLTPPDTAVVRVIITVTMMISLFGFLFFFISRSTYKDDKTVKILGILDIFSSVFILLMYVATAFMVGL